MKISAKSTAVLPFRANKKIHFPLEYSGLSLSRGKTFKNTSHVVCSGNSHCLLVLLSFFNKCYRNLF